jgi:hypothetical protein
MPAPQHLPALPFITALAIPQGDGSTLIRPGRVIPNSRLTTREVARLLGLSQRRVQSLCTEGGFTTAAQLAQVPGQTHPRKWTIAASEVLSRLASPPP